MPAVATWPETCAMRIGPDSWSVLSVPANSPPIYAPVRSTMNHVSLTPPARDAAKPSVCTFTSAGSIAGWIYLVLFGSVVGYTSYVWLLANAPLGMVSTYAYVNPIVAISLGVLFRGEHLTWRLLVGAVIVVAAVAAVVSKEPATAPPPDEGVVCGPLEADVVRADRYAA